jgi:hypothetical protein
LPRELLVRPDVGGRYSVDAIVPQQDGEADPVEAAVIGYHPKMTGALAMQGVDERPWHSGRPESTHSDAGAVGDVGDRL